jgi:hypothetical protein
MEISGESSISVGGSLRSVFFVPGEKRTRSFRTCNRKLNRGLNDDSIVGFKKQITECSSLKSLLTPSTGLGLCCSCCCCRLGILHNENGTYGPSPRRQYGKCCFACVSRHRYGCMCAFQWTFESICELACACVCVLVGLVGV